MLGNKKGFTLLELMVVVILIGILTTLAYSSLIELIQTNKAKEAARTMTAFVERAITEGKMRKNQVKITATGNTINADAVGSSAPFATSLLDNGFSFANSASKPPDCGNAVANAPVTAEVKVGISGISGLVCFVACNPSDYCGAAVKTATKNTFEPYLKRKNSTTWEALL